MNLVFAWGIEIALVLVRGSKLTWFCAGGRIDFIFVDGPKMTRFSAGIEIDVFFLCVVKIGLISV